MDPETERFLCRSLLGTPWLVAALIWATACASPEPPPSVAEDDGAWETALLEQRADKDEEFRTSRTSPMAGTQYLKSEPAGEVFLTRDGKTFALEYQANASTSLHMKKVESANVESGNVESAWHWNAGEDGVECQVDGEMVTDGSALDTYATFAVAGLDLSFYPAEDRVTFIVFDPARSEMSSFEHLLYYSPDRGYVVEATLDELAEPDAIEMPTSQNLVKTFYRFARISFDLKGEPHELTAFRYDLDGDRPASLFIPFKDATSGRQSYGGGRFLEIDTPESDRFTLDFNLSFSPLCNYSPAYNCTIPPRENHLDVAIRAGEKTYPH